MIYNVETGKPFYKLSLGARNCRNEFYWQEYIFRVRPGDMIYNVALTYSEIPLGLYGIKSCSPLAANAGENLVP